MYCEVALEGEGKKGREGGGGSCCVGGGGMEVSRVERDSKIYL